MIAISDPFVHLPPVLTLQRWPSSTRFGPKGKIACQIVESLVTLEGRCCQSRPHTQQPAVSSFPSAEEGTAAACLHAVLSPMFAVVVVPLDTKGVTELVLTVELRRISSYSLAAIARIEGFLHHEKHILSSPRTDSHQYLDHVAPT